MLIFFLLIKFIKSIYEIIPILILLSNYYYILNKILLK